MSIIRGRLKRNPGREHDPRTCKICKKEGDWATTTDTSGWFDKHAKAGFQLRIVTESRVEVITNAEKKKRRI